MGHLVLLYTRHGQEERRSDADGWTTLNNPHAGESPLLHDSEREANAAECAPTTLYESAGHAGRMCRLSGCGSSRMNSWGRPWVTADNKKQSTPRRGGS
jgi:hypothetical protein